MLRVGTCPRALQVAAALECPVALELGTAWAFTQAIGQVVPPHPAMLLHVAMGDAVGHALVAERIHQPIEDDGRVVPLHRGDYPLPRQTDPAVVDQVPRAGDLADAAHQVDCSTKERCSCHWALRISAIAGNDSDIAARP